MGARREILVGFLFFLGLSVFFAFSILLAGQEVKLFEQKTTFLIRFPSVSRIVPGTPVTINGVPVGSVSSVRNNAVGSVDCEVSVNEDVVIHEGYQVAITTTLFGSKAIDIRDSRYDAEDNERAQINLAVDWLEGGEDTDLMLSFAFAAQQAETTLATVNTTLEEVNTTIKSINDPQAGLIGRLVGDSELADDMHTLVLESTETLKVLQSTADEVADFLRVARDGDGVIPMLMTDAEVKEQFRQSLESISTTMSDLSATASDVRRVADRIDRGEGILGWLVSDTGARDNLDSLLANLAEASPHLTRTLESTASVMNKVDSGNSTLGRLINDDTLYIQLTQTIRAANRSLEDLRETTPITTFANLLFQAFQ